MMLALGDKIHSIEQCKEISNSNKKALIHQFYVALLKDISIHGDE